MVKKDERMAGTTEILNGIKYIKMSGWENAFLQKVFILIWKNCKNNLKNRFQRQEMEN